MTKGPGKSAQIRQLARYEVRPEALERCLAAIHEFVAYVRAKEPGTLRYEVWQEPDHPTRLVHIFVFRDAAADRAHSESAEVKKFASVYLDQEDYVRLQNELFGHFTRAMAPVGILDEPEKATARELEDWKGSLRIFRAALETERQLGEALLKEYDTVLRGK